MHLHPHNLGARLNQEVRQERGRVVYGSKGAAGMDNTRTAVGFALSLLAAVPLWAFDQSFLASIASVTAFCFGGTCLVLTVKGREAARLLKSPLLDYELCDLWKRETDPLAREYINLARSVLALPATHDAQAEREVADAVSALGTAIVALPPEPPVAMDDPDALRAEAQAQEIAAATEADSVIAASRRRRTESLARRADTTARTILLLRRNQALREEVGEQVRALQTSLNALQVGGRQSAPELAGLAASIQRVALEANAVTVARAEVDALLSQPGAVGSEAQPVGIGGRQERTSWNKR